jgi:hypothetical protein
MDNKHPLEAISDYIRATREPEEAEKLISHLYTAFELHGKQGEEGLKTFLELIEAEENADGLGEHA